MTRPKNYPPPQIFQLNELVKLNYRLTELGIKVVYFKGMLDHLRLTGKLPLRPKFDTDLLVKKSNFNPLAKLFLGNGYTLFLEDITKPLSIKTAIKYPQVTFLKSIAGHKIIFDVHFLVLNPTSSPIDLLPRELIRKITAEVFGRRQQITLFGRKFNLLDINDLLLVSCLSFFFHHRCQGKSRLDDIASIISPIWLDWPTVITRGRHWRLSPCLFIVLRMVSKYTSAVVPQIVFDKFNSGRPITILTDLFINRWTLTYPIPRDHLVNRALSLSYATLLRLAVLTAR